MTGHDPTPVQATIHQLIDKLRALRAEVMLFWNTRRAVLGGSGLWDFTTEQRRKDAVVEPWNFILIQCALMVLVSAIASKLTVFFYPVVNKLPAVALSRDPEVERLALAAAGFVAPFTLPAFLTSFVWLMAWGTLRSRDSTAEARKRASAAYLYLLGAHSFFPVLVLAAAIAPLSIGRDRSAILELLPLSLGYYRPDLVGYGHWPTMFFSAALVWQTFVLVIWVPLKLFRANGYGYTETRMRPPWVRFLLSFGVAVWPLWVIVLGLGAAVSYAIAYAVLAGRGAIGLH